MKYLFPRMGECLAFALVALAFSAVVLILRLQEMSLVLFAIPMAAAAAWMGMRRSGQWDSLTGSPPKPVEVEAEEHRADPARIGEDRGSDL